MRHLRVTTLGLLTLYLAACLAEPLDDEASAIETVEQNFHFRGAAFVRPPPPPPTLNECRGLECQTIDVSLANLPTTTCADGSEAESCPVIDFDFSELDLHPRILTTIMEQTEVWVAVAGDLVPSRPHEEFGLLQTLIVWAGVSGAVPQGQVYTVETADLFCDSDCDIHAELLNWPDELHLTGLDLSRVELTTFTLTEAQEAAAEGLLMLVGRVGPDGVLSATEALVPVAVAASAL